MTVELLLRRKSSKSSKYVINTEMGKKIIMLSNVFIKNDFKKYMESASILQTWVWLNYWSVSSQFQAQDEFSNLAYGNQNINSA